MYALSTPNYGEFPSVGKQIPTNEVFLFKVLQFSHLLNRLMI